MKVIAIATSDWHLSHRPPVWRSVEPNWYEAMDRMLDQLRSLARLYSCPFLFAGDLFDYWDSPAELINWASEVVPAQIHAIPGQHDLPHHEYEALVRSAYGTLIRTGDLFPLAPISSESSGQSVYLKDQLVVLHAFPFGYPIQVYKGPHDDLHIAIAHQYVWMPNHNPAHAGPATSLAHLHSENMIGSRLYGYDTIIYGDNHQGWCRKVGDTHVFNCGTLMRRSSSEISYLPQVGLLCSDGQIQPRILDTAGDLFLNILPAEASLMSSAEGLQRFTEELQRLTHSSLDFADAYRQYCQGHSVPQAIQKLIDEAREE